MNMIDIDIYHDNHVVEEFLQSLKLKINRDCHNTIKVYISTANPYNHWLQKLYSFYNEKEE